MTPPPAPPPSAGALEALLHSKIPLTRAMEVRVVELGAERVVVEAPLASNSNHMGTAFGGSLHVLPTLAGYGLVWSLLQEAGLGEGHVVLTRSRASYDAPVLGTLRAVCARPSPEIVARFIATVRRHRKARMELACIVEGTGAAPAVVFQGTFAAVL